MLATDTPPPFAGLTPAPTPPPPGSAPTGRKRKQAPAQASTSTASTPPPEGSTPAPTTTIISDRSDLSTRERRTISRYPIFLPALNQPLASTSTPRSRSPSSSSADPDDDPLFYTTDGIPHNSLRFRYYPAGVNSPGAILTCRTIESLPCSYRISWEDRSPFLKVSRSGLRLLGDKGFRSARGNAPVREGRWYFEVKIEKGGGEPGARAEGAHVRLGWSRREAPLNAPVGVDGYSYAYRDKTGEKVTLSRPRPYGAPFRSGDTVGMYIALPPRRTPGTVRTRGGKEVPDPHDPANIRRNRIPIDFKGQEYFETLEYQASKEMISLMEAQSAKPSASASLPSAPSKKSGATVKNMSNARAAAASAKKAQPELRPLPTLGPDSCLAFFVNGVCQGVAFRDLYDYLPLRAPNDAAAAQRHRKKRDGGTHHEHAPNPFDDGTLGYYPTLSLFNDARVRLNPGPDFEYPPPDDVDAVLAEHERKRQGEGEDDKSQLKMDVDADIKPSTQRTWRPLCERYPEYMAEQWALDDEEEARARAALADDNVDDPSPSPLPALPATTKPPLDNEAEEKRQQRLAKRRAQAAARKKAKLAQQAHPKDDLLSVPGGSPLRQSATPYMDTDPDAAGTPDTAGVYYSPAVTPDPALMRSRTYSPDLDPDMDRGASLRPYSPAASASSGVEVRDGVESEDDERDGHTAGAEPEYMEFEEAPPPMEPTKEEEEEEEEDDE